VARATSSAAAARKVDQRHRGDEVIALDIPGFGGLTIHRVVSDYSGTHALGGVLRPGVVDRLIRLAALVEIHIVTSDTFGTAQRELATVPVTFHLLTGDRHDEQKRSYVCGKDPRTVAAFGNGMNDRLLLKTVKDAGGLAVAVDNGEGCAVETMLNAHILVSGSENALDLLLEPGRCKATLRF
jgi:soluble P-type ATPase